VRFAYFGCAVNFTKRFTDARYVCLLVDPFQASLTTTKGAEMTSVRQTGQAALLTLGMLLIGRGALAAGAIEGFTEPNRRIDVAPAETGTIATLAVREGERVHRGQQLASLDCDVLQVSLDIARSGMTACGRRNSAVAERDVRKNRLEKLELLRQGGHASQEEVDRARGDLAVAEAALLAAEEQHQLDRLEHKKIEAMIERRILRSPIDGIVLKIHKEEREFVSANNPAVFTLVQLDTLRVTFGVPTAQAASLAVGQTVRVAFPETGARADGKIEFIAPLTDAESGTVRVKILLDNAAGRYGCGVRCALGLHHGDTASTAPALPLVVGAAK
jgi:RND family efflux transporter MFP subunit